MVSHTKERGAVHILFFVSVLVVALAFGGLWFVQLQENEKLVDDARRKGAESDLWKSKATFAYDCYAIVAKKAGGGFPTSIPMPADEEVATTTPEETLEAQVRNVDNALRGVGAQVDDSAADPKTIRDAWNPILGAYEKLKTTIDQKNAEITNLQAQLTAARNDLSNAQTTASNERQQAQQEMEAVQSRLNSQAGELRRQNDDYASRNRELTEEVDRTKDTANEERQAMVLRTSELEGQVKNMKNDRKRKRAVETPDGKVLDADVAAGTAFIDIGSRDTLVRGTRFKVYETGKGQTKIHKGWMVVTDIISPTMAKCRIESSTPGTGAISRGDWLYSPIFDRGEGVRFAILGRLPGRYTSESASRILTGYGAKVQDGVNIETDFLVVGMKENPDDEELTESESYKTAERWGVPILRARDLVDFMKL